MAIHVGGRGPGHMRRLVFSAAAVPSLADTLLATIGPWLTPAQLVSAGSPFADYESNFGAAATAIYASQGTDPTGGDATGSSGYNYYGRARIFYVAHARTGSSTYLTMARAQAKAFVDWVISSDYGENTDAAIRFIDPEGTAAYYEDMTLSGNATEAAHAITALGRQASVFDTWYADFASAYGGGGQHFSDNRERSYMLRALFWAMKYNAPSLAWTTTSSYAQGSTTFWGAGSWASRLSTQLSLLLSLQESSGRWGIASKPFMTGLLHEALVRLYEGHTGLTNTDRANIQTAIQKSLDYIWTNQWLSASNCFQYTEDTGDSDYGSIYPDLNALISAGFGWYAKRLVAASDPTNAAVYRSRHDTILYWGVSYAVLTQPKAFNQQYSDAHSGIAFANAIASTFVPPVWSRYTAAAGMTFSNSNHTVTVSTGTYHSLVSGLAKSTGKWFLKVTPGSVGNCGVGFADSTWNVETGDYLGGTAGSVCAYSSGTTYKNGSTVATVAAFTAATDEFIALDADNRTFWIRKGTGGNWNNDASANPATNTGGISLSGLVGDLKFAFMFANSGDSLTVDFSPSETKPSGFLNWI